MMKTYKNILIVRTDRVGDVVLTTPAIKALKQTFPQAKISILIQPLTRDLVQGNPYLDQVYKIETGGERGIRTLDTFPYTHFPGVLLRPLGHLS